MASKYVRHVSCEAFSTFMDNLHNFYDNNITKIDYTIETGRLEIEAEKIYPTLYNYLEKLEPRRYTNREEKELQHYVN